MTHSSIGRRQPELVVALDLPTGEEALELVGRFSTLPLWFKVGLELFTAAGPELVRSLREQGFPVFLDLKFHDIPNTVQSVTRVAAGMGVQMSTLHLDGGEEMSRAAVRGRDAVNAGQGKMLLMGVTVLTSQGLADGGLLKDLVVQKAIHAREWGLDGVVCSGQEAAAVKKACGDDFLCLCPGIRFPGESGKDDQARITTPEQAVADGADFLVIGRPITRAASPRGQAMRALDMIRAALG